MKAALVLETVCKGLNSHFVASDQLFIVDFIPRIYENFTHSL